jgi:serine/threonine-protein kinase RsbW
VPAGAVRGPDPQSDDADGWTVTIPSDVTVLSSMRGRLANWAHTNGLSSAAADDLALAAYEALANSTEHAYQERPGYIRLTTRRTNDHVTITVTDHGRWLVPTAPGNRGRGLLLMHKLADDVHVAIDKDHPSTTIRLRWRLSAPTPHDHN